MNEASSVARGDQLLKGLLTGSLLSHHIPAGMRDTSFGMLRLTILSSHFQVRVQLLLQMPSELHVISINLYILKSSCQIYRLGSRSSLTNTVIVPTEEELDGSKALSLKPAEQGALAPVGGQGVGGMGGHPRMTVPFEEISYCRTRYSSHPSGPKAP